MYPKTLPFISVIIPVYNTEKYLKKTIDSVLSQTYGNFELILVNDGSADQSGAICEEYAKVDSRIKVLHQENSGVSNARNVGIDYSSGDYIQFIDSDDDVVSNMFQLLVNKIQSHNCDIVVFGHTNKGNIGPMRRQVKASTSLYNKRDFLYHFYTDSNKSSLIWCCWSMIFKASIIKENNIYFNKEFSFGEDRLFTLNCIIDSNTILVIDQVLYNYNHFEQDQRISAVGRIRPDIYELRLYYFEILLKDLKQYLPYNKQITLYHAFYDQLIAGIVRFGAYTEYFTKAEILERLHRLLNDDSVIQAGKGYKRKRKEDSYLLPFLMKRRAVKLLSYILQIEGKRYIKKWGKNNKVGSIYSDKNFTRINPKT